MRSRRQRSRVSGICGIGAAVTAGLAIAGCGGGSSGASSSNGAAADRNLVIGIPPAVTTGSLYLAKQQGIFAKNGLNVTIKSLNGGAATVPALESGAINLAQSNVLSVIQGANSGIDAPCFAGAFSQRHIQALIAGRKSGITKVSQLAGKTVAVNATGGVNQLITESYLADHGVPPSSVKYVALAFPDMPAALSSDRVSAVLGVEPFDTQMEQAGGRVLSTSPADSIAGKPIFSCWNASGSWLKSNQSTVKSFVRAMRQTISLISAHPSMLVRALEKNTAVPKSVLAKSAMPRFTLAMSARDVKDWESAAKKYGLIHSAPPASKVYSPPS